MGHVDHAHQAEGDGQSQRGQQQDAAQTQAVKQVGGLTGPPLVTIDPIQRLHSGCTDRSVDLGVARQGRDQSPIAEPAGLCQNGHRLQPHGRICALQVELGHGNTQPVPHRCIGFLFEPRPQHSIGFGCRLFGHCPGAGQALAGIRRGDLHLSPDGSELTPQGIRQGWRDQFGVGRWRRAAEDVTPTVSRRTVNPSRLVHLELAFGQFGQQRECPGIVAARQRSNCFAHIAGAAQTQGGHRRGQGVVRAFGRRKPGWLGDEQAQQENRNQSPGWHTSLTPSP